MRQNWHHLEVVPEAMVELAVLKGGETTLGRARLLFLEVRTELLDALEIRLEQIFDWLKDRDWTVESTSGRRMERVQFSDQIHTFWTVCRR